MASAKFDPQKPRLVQWSLPSTIWPAFSGNGWSIEGNKTTYFQMQTRRCVSSGLRSGCGSDWSIRNQSVSGSKASNIIQHHPTVSSFLQVSLANRSPKCQESGTNGTEMDQKWTRNGTHWSSVEPEHGPTPGLQMNP